MSRRKQSNPKPVKRSEDEDDENDVDSKMNQSDLKEMDTDQSDTSLHGVGDNVTTDTEICENGRETTPSRDIHDNVKVKMEIITHDDDIEKEEQQQGAMSPRRLEVMRKLNFPADLLTLRQVDESEFLQTGIPWSVTSHAELSKGSTIGPYQGETVALSSIKPGELVLQFQGQDGEFSFIKVTEGSGSWLSLLRPADSANSQNTKVIFHNGRIWCEIIEDLKQGTELLASFTTHEEELSFLKQEKSGSDKGDTQGQDVKLVSGVPKKHESKSVPQITPQPALIHGCLFCGVRFSSRRTLEAHLTYYCSKKPSDFVNLHELHQQLQQARAMFENKSKTLDIDTAHATSPTDHGEQKSPHGIKRSREGRSTSPGSSDDHTSDGEGRERKVAKIGDMYKCGSCSYATDKITLLQKHQHHYHNGENRDSVDVERLSVSPMCQDETFCKECKIQFSSVSTYKGHKEFYCQFREMGSQKDVENVSEMASPGSKDCPSDLTLKLLQAQHASLESGHAFVTSQGHLHPALLAANPLLASPLVIKDFFMKNSDKGETTKALSKPPSVITSPVIGSEMPQKQPADDQPLDLSKSSLNSVKSESPSSKSDSGSNKDIIKTEGSKSPEISSETEGAATPQASKTPLNIPSIHPTLLLGNQVQYVNKKPIPPLQSVSRCVECNIVFYKRENYLIHKEHYCSGRRSNKDSTSSDSDNPEVDSKETESVHTKPVQNILSPNKNKLEADVKQEVNNKEPVAKSEICYKYYCIPCKIKFSSAGTLKAHKEFYCPHGKDNENMNDKDSNGERSTPNSCDNLSYQCEHCKNDYSSARLLKQHICMAPAPLLRCPYCDYITQTENRLSEHMKVHVPTKAFKCNICGYRGNTARGMRMHGKMHIENGEEFTDDNMIEFEEPPVVPIQRNGVSEKGPIDVDTELIRMKNEPYKRRRSRKSFEKSENMVSFLGQNMLTCPACGQTFTNVHDYVIHVHMHEIAAKEAIKIYNSKSLPCEHCDYTADSVTTLLLHMQSKHPEQLPGTSKCDLEGHSDSERSRSSDSHIFNDRSRSCSVDSIKMTSNSSQGKHSLESSLPVSMETVTSNDSEQNLNMKENNKNSSEGNKYVKCEAKSEKNDLTGSTKSHKDLKEESRSINSYFLKNGSPSQVSPPFFHISGSQEPIKSPQSAPPSLIKSEPLSPPQLREISKSVSPPKGITSSLHSDKISPKLMSPDPKTRYLLSQNNMGIKQELTSPPKSDTPKKVSPPISPRTPIISPKPTLPLGAHSPSLPNIPLLYTPHGVLTPFHYPGIPISLIPATAIQTSPTLPASSMERIGRKYCKHCDINFTYLSSFLTHKKYYCSARTTSEDSQSPTATA
ncbi:hypothetical protein ACF0H5_005825 [Mactra antiquata]